MERKSKYMSLDALSRTLEFRSLTVRQQLWCQTYCASIRDLGVPDAVFATQSAFGNDGENSRTMSYQLLRNPKVKAAIRVWQNFGKSPRQIALDDLRADLAASKPGSAARARLREIEAKLIGAKPKRKSK